MFVLQAMEDAEAIPTDDDALPSYMADQSLCIFPKGCKPRKWSAILLAFWYYRVSATLLLASSLRWTFLAPCVLSQACYQLWFISWYEVLLTIFWNVQLACYAVVIISVIGVFWTAPIGIKNGYVRPSPLDCFHALGGESFLEQKRGNILVSQSRECRM